MDDGVKAIGEREIGMEKNRRSSFRNRISAGMLLLLAAACMAVVPRLSGHAIHRAAGKRSTAAAFTAKPTPARLARGRYLVETVASCFDCHSPHEYVNGQWFGKPGMKGAGQVFPPGFVQLPPGAEIVASNITPDRQTGIGSWTDAQIEQAIRHGIGKGGRPLFDMMPYSGYRYLTTEDVKSIIVYLRSLPPVHNALPRTKMPFPIHVNMNSTPPLPLAKNAPGDVRHGWYLVHMAGCADCHTQIMPGGVRRESMLLAGGMDFHGPFGNAVSLNITPSASGIGSWTEAMFVRTLQTGRVKGTGRKLSPIMPYASFMHMKPSDLRAIYSYLRTVPPVSHK